MKVAGVVFKIKKSSRAKRMRLNVSARGEVLVVLPLFVPKYFAKRMVQERQVWIKKRLADFEKRKVGDRRLFVYSREQYLKYKEEAREFCMKRVAYWAEKMGLSYNRIAIKDMKTRWGSCSNKKNLNFNYKIIFLNERQADYLIVHELAHLQEMNHSRAFWSLVEEFVPDFRELRQEIKILL